MYKRTRPTEHRIKVNNSYQGETIEQKMDRIVNNNEPIKDGAPIIYTERKDGVLPEYDIRTDRFEVAVEAQDKITRAKLGERAERHKTPEQKQKEQDEKEAKSKDKPGTKSEGETA